MSTAASSLHGLPLPRPHRPRNLLQGRRLALALLQHRRLRRHQPHRRLRIGLHPPRNQRHVRLELAEHVPEQDPCHHHRKPDHRHHPRQLVHPPNPQPPPPPALWGSPPPF